MYTKFILPTYTSERYYLLSEIEQRGKFINLSDESIKSNYIAVYFLWSCYDSHVDEFFEQLQHFINYITRNYSDIKQANILFAIETLSTSESNIINIDKAYSILKGKFPDSLIIFGVSNHTGASCALESILDYCHHIERLNESIVILSLSNDSLMGFNPISEPDAASNVNQYLVSSLDKRISDWSRQLLNFKVDDYAYMKNKTTGFSFLLGLLAIVGASYAWKVLGKKL